MRWPEWGGKKQGPLFALAYLAIWQDPAALGSASVVTVAVLAALCHAYLLNAVADRSEDLITGKLQPFATRSLLLQRIVLLAIPTVSLLTLLLLTDWVALLGVALIFVAGWLYSAGPRLRDRPVPGTIVAALGQRTAPLLAFMGLIDLSAPAWLGLQVAFLGSGLRGILVHQFIDREADQRSGHVTVALLIGEHRTRQLLVLITRLELIGLVVSGLWSTPIVIALALFAAGGLAGNRIWRNWTWYQRAADYAHLPLNHLYFFFLPVTCAGFALASTWQSAGFSWPAIMLSVIFVSELAYRWSVLKGVAEVARISLSGSQAKGQKN